MRRSRNQRRAGELCCTAPSEWHRSRLEWTSSEMELCIVIECTSNAVRVLAPDGVHWWSSLYVYDIKEMNT